MLIFPCTIKSRSSLLALADPGGPRKRAVKRLWCGGGGGTSQEIGWEEHIQNDLNSINQPSFLCLGSPLMIKR